MSRETSWTYRGRPVFIDSLRGIVPALRPDGRRAHLVQRALDGLEPWGAGEMPIQEHELDGEAIMPVTVPIHPGEEITWGVRIGTKRREGRGDPLSPFTRRAVSPVRLLTIELRDTMDHPVLIRAYGGEYTPSLPGTKNVRNTPGGWPAARRFWMAHARPIAAMIPGSASSRPPRWWLQESAGGA